MSDNVNWSYFAKTRGIIFEIMITLMMLGTTTPGRTTVHAEKLKFAKIAENYVI